MLFLVLSLVVLSLVLPSIDVNAARYVFVLPMAVTTASINFEDGSRGFCQEIAVYLYIAVFLISNHYKEPTESEIQEMVNTLVSGEAYYRVLNHLHAPLEGKVGNRSAIDQVKLGRAIQNRFGGNTATKKTHKNLLKQQYENIVASSSEVIEQTYERLQKLISQLEMHGEVIPQEDIN
ncbi:hypothetical protein Tco_0810895 [Tanacetum coccineum]